jgi:hypothetical protein
MERKYISEGEMYALSYVAKGSTSIFRDGEGYYRARFIDAMEGVYDVQIVLSGEDVNRLKVKEILDLRNFRKARSLELLVNAAGATVKSITHVEGKDSSLIIRS